MIVTFVGLVGTVDVEKDCCDFEGVRNETNNGIYTKLHLRFSVDRKILQDIEFVRPAIVRLSIIVPFFILRCAVCHCSIDIACSESKLKSQVAPASGISFPGLVEVLRVACQVERSCHPSRSAVFGSPILLDRNIETEQESHAEIHPSEELSWKC